MSTSPAYNIRYTLPNPIIGGNPPKAWMLSVSFLAVAAIVDQDAFFEKAGTSDLNAAFNKWVPVAAVSAQSKLSEAAMMTTNADDVLGQADALAEQTQKLLTRTSAEWGLEIRDFKFEKLERPADETARLRQLGLA